ncbi:TonB-dependent siderophore receptor [Steroidobacter sp.]|uniref:TonB-dependent siderophore receptor n=1 Tax=Steroidobacter sp. TaxID=1978227 RepID=UPI001A5376A2|nr:TonB-dependent siderophore receptor [Steroidobacter sp.]MBL8271589.1 TonB-dependent siderophore receptor [Steroidobacter sp.]
MNHSNTSSRSQSVSDKKVSLSAMYAAPALALAALPLMAQEANDDSKKVSEDAEEIIVSGSRLKINSTATKIPLTIRETPQAISIVTAESIEKRFAQDTISAVEISSGVSPGRVAPGAFAGRGFRGDRFTMRGQEGSVRSDGFSFGGSLSSFDPAAFERIEVVKGPAGFYGQGSLGGFINLVRKKPKDVFEGNISTQAGSYETYRVDADVTGPLNDANTLRGRINAGYSDAGSFVDGVETQTRLIAPSFEALIGERTRVLLQLWSQGSEYIPNPGIPTHVIGNRIEPANLPRSFYFGIPSQEKSNEEILDAILRIDQTLSDRWLASVLFQGSKDDTKLIFDSYGFDFGGVGDAYMYANTQEVNQDRWATELRLAGSFDAFGAEHQVLVGAEMNRLQEDYLGRYAYLGPANLYAGNFAGAGIGNDSNLSVYSDNRTTVKNKAVYAQAVLGLPVRTKLLLSARYDWSEIERLNNLNNSGTDSKKSELTMRIGVSHEINDHFTAYAVWAQSFNPVTARSRTNSILDPETGSGYESGLKTEWFGGKLDATLSVYQQTLDNRPILDPANGPGQSFSISAGAHRTRGVEAEVNGTPLTGFTVGASATWMTNEFRDERDPNFGLSINDSIGRQFSLYADYQVQTGVLEGLVLGGTVVSYGDREYITRRNPSQIYADGYERVDLHVSYNAIPKWELSLHLRNLLDEKYLERASSTTFFNNFYGSPRAVLGRVKYSF